MKLRGTIASLKIDSNKIKINFKDIIEFEKGVKYIFALDNGENNLELLKVENKEFNLSSLNLEKSLLYQLYKEKQLLIFETKDETITETEKNIISLEII